MFLINWVTKLNAASNTLLENHFGSVVTVGITLCAACMIITIV